MTKSNLWYLLPLIFTLPGGIIMYFAVKNEEPAKAKKGLIIGAVFLAWMIAASALGLTI